MLVFIGSPVNRYFRFACLSNIIKLLFPFRSPIKLDTLIFVLYPLLSSFLLIGKSLFGTTCLAGGFPYTKKVSEGTVFLPFGYFSFYCFTFPSRHYPLTAPTIIPFTKYFCRKGYSSRIGTVATMIFAYLMDSDSIGESLPSVVADTSFIIRT